MTRNANRLTASALEQVVAGNGYCCGVIIRRALFGVLLAILTHVSQAPALAQSPDSLVLFDPDTARWHSRSPDGAINEFSFGDPGDVPLWGDWDCDGVDSAAVFQPSSDGIVIRGTSDSGHRTFRLPVTDALPLGGDWNGDGCDTVSAYHTDRVLVINELGGPVEKEFFFGVAGDVPIAGDFDGDGISSVGVFRTGLSRVYLRNTLDTGGADLDYAFGSAQGYIAVGDWNGDGLDTLAHFRPEDGAFSISMEHSADAFPIIIDFGESAWIPPGGLKGPEPAKKARILLLVVTALFAVGAIAAAGWKRPFRDERQSPA